MLVEAKLTEMATVLFEPDRQPPILSAFGVTARR
jgi:hypothetical protein